MIANIARLLISNQWMCRTAINISMWINNGYSIQLELMTYQTLSSYYFLYKNYYSK